MDNAGRAVISAGIAPGFKFVSGIHMPLAKLGRLIFIEAIVHAHRNLAGLDQVTEIKIRGRIVNRIAAKDDQQIDVTPAGDHPVTAGLVPFRIQDEAYKNLRMSPKIRPLLTTDNPACDRNLAWVGPLEGAKVVAIQLGHGPSAFGNPSYRALVHNAVLWAAGKTK